ncbi:hypothetical protein Slin15195_G121610 [Septoria linicola]|uniref:Uncharacterized protein n=1 Tax=Septoria linicola TaxID=215465 RepID=A0A9Q9B7Q7_9PEZI|nr:hypothetical protein Slin14017_G098600 [Septoria linicola]USW58842.1 hypothetical protein Slin15195_G121610 [Septoria linicola]
MATLTTLPAELVAHIAELTDPASHMDLICTCSYIAGALRGIIKRHRAAAAQSSYCDLLPNTIPDLLRKIWTDPITAYISFSWSTDRKGSDLRGDRCGLFYPEVLGGYNSGVDLRNVTLVVSDLALGSMFHSDKDRYPEPRERCVRYVMLPGDDSPLPSTLEVLVFVGDFAHLGSFLGEDDIPLAQTADWFDDALAAMISGRVEVCDDEDDEGEKVEGQEEKQKEEGDDNVVDETDDGEGPGSPRRNSEDLDQHEQVETGDEDQYAEQQAPYVYPNLRVIYIDPWPQIPRHDLADERGPKLWLQKKSIQAAHERGIEVRSRVNVNSYHQPIDLHIPPDRYDMRPEISPPTNETFVPISGEWCERGCRNCGTCPPCLELFTKEAWATAYKAATNRSRWFVLLSIIEQDEIDTRQDMDSHSRADWRG